MQPFISAVGVTGVQAQEAGVDQLCFQGDYGDLAIEEKTEGMLSSWLYPQQD